MKSSIGGCSVGEEDVSMGPKSNQNISLFILLSENCESFEWIHDTGNDHQFRRSYFGYYLQQGVEQVIIALSTRPLHIIPQFGTFL